MPIDPAKLKQFLPFKELGDRQLSAIAERIHLQRAGRGVVLVELDSRAPEVCFLYSGSVQRQAADGRINLLRAGDSSSYNPLSQLLPHRFQVTTQSAVEYFVLSPAELADIHRLSHANRIQEHGEIIIHEHENQDAVALEHELLLQFMQDLENDRLELPSLPDVALKIGRAIDNGINDAEKIADIVMLDPGIAAKLLKTANSAFYSGKVRIESLAMAIVRMGFKSIRQLVMGFALKELFQSSSPLLQRRMTELWRHSTRVAAICYVLARHDQRFDPEEAMLAGLLHDIGMVALLSNLNKYTDDLNNEMLINDVTHRLRAETGGMILRRWGFAQHLVTAAVEAENWMYDSGTGDYCDLVIIAQLHSYIGSRRFKDLPAIDAIPARYLLSLGDLTPTRSFKILEDSEEQILAMESLLF